MPRSFFRSLGARTMSSTTSSEAPVQVRPKDTRLQLVSCLDRLAPEALCEHAAASVFGPGVSVWFTSAGRFHVRGAAPPPPTSRSVSAGALPSGAWFAVPGARRVASAHIDADTASRDGVETLSHDAFRSRFGFCVTFWCITHPDATLSRESAARWALISPPAGTKPSKPFRRYIIRMFLAADDDGGCIPGRYYACEEVARDNYRPLDLHVLKMEHLRVIVDWSRRIGHVDEKGVRAPRLPEGELTKTQVLDAVDAFCIKFPGKVIGPPLPRSRA